LIKNNLWECERFSATPRIIGKEKHWMIFCESRKSIITLDLIECNMMIDFKMCCFILFLILPGSVKAQLE